MDLPLITWRDYHKKVDPEVIARVDKYYDNDKGGWHERIRTLKPDELSAYFVVYCSDRMNGALADVRPIVMQEQYKFEDIALVCQLFFDGVGVGTRFDDEPKSYNTPPLSDEPSLEDIQKKAQFRCNLREDWNRLICKYNLCVELESVIEAYDELRRFEQDYGIHPAFVDTNPIADSYFEAINQLEYQDNYSLIMARKLLEAYKKNEFVTDKQLALLKNIANQWKA